MKNMNAITSVFLVLFSVNAMADVMSCFEREWIIARTSSTPANVTMSQVDQVIKSRVPALKVKAADQNKLLVEYKPMKTLQEDKAFLRQTFQYLTQQSGLIIECNATIDPQPSMTGRNFR